MSERRRRGLDDDDPRHGTENGYQNYGCRCDPCRAARKAARTLHDPYDERHGTYNGYRNYGCRCDPCKAANSAHQREKRAKAPEPPRAVQDVNAYTIEAPEEWQERGVCKGHTSLFFPSHDTCANRGGHSVQCKAWIATAKAMCRRCPVLEDCAAYIAAWPQEGIWAGTTDHERRKRTRSTT